MLLRTAERIKDFVSSEIVLLLIAALLIFGGWGFSSLADEVTEGDTQKFDEWLMRQLRTGEDLKDTWGPVWLEEAAVDVTALGGMTVYPLVTAAVALYLLLSRHYARMWMVLIATIGGAILVFWLKDIFDRPRPDIVPHLTTHRSMSFPSGHAALSATIYLTLGVLLAQATKLRRLKVFFMAIALGLTLLIGSSRVFLGVHYPTDVLAGWCIGLAWAAAVWIVAFSVQRWRHKPVAEGLEPEPKAA